MGDVSLAGSLVVRHVAATTCRTGPLNTGCNVNAALVNACIGSYLHIFLGELYTVSQKKVPTFKLSVTLSNLNRFSKFLHSREAYEICYKSMHLRHVATLPREIKNSIFKQMWKKTQTNCILIASNFVIHPQIFIFSGGTQAQLSGGQAAAGRVVKRK